jgi:hypothetical protein
MNRKNDDDIFENLSKSMWVTSVTVPGRAGRYIKKFFIRPGQIFIICCRVSGSERRANLEDRRQETPRSARDC